MRICRLIVCLLVSVGLFVAVGCGDKPAAQQSGKGVDTAKRLPKKDAG